MAGEELRPHTEASVLRAILAQSSPGDKMTGAKKWCLLHEQEVYEVEYRTGEREEVRFDEITFILLPVRSHILLLGGFVVSGYLIGGYG